MSNEYTAHYAGKSHRELYDQLMAGKPDQIDGVATAWHTSEGTARHIAGEIEKDLKNLDWTSEAGREYQRRLGVVSAFSKLLADDQGAMKRSLTEMSGQLRTTQKQAQSEANPSDTDDNDSMMGGAAIGGSTFGVPGLIVGGILGHERDERQKKEAQQRMVLLMSTLAADYTVTGAKVGEPLPPPVSLPGGNPGSDVDPQGNPHVTTQSNAAKLGQFGNGTTHGTVDVGPVSTGPGTNTVTDPALTQVVDPTAGTSLLGVESGVIGAGGTLVAGTALAGQLVSLGGGAGGVNAGLATTGLASSVPAGGVLGRGGTGGSGGTTAGQRGGSLSPRGGAGQRGSTGGLKDSTGRTAGARPSGKPGADPNRASRTGGPGREGMLGQQRGAGPTARNGVGDDEDEQHDTWLTEDDMVWGDDENAPPPVLGGSPPPPPPSPGG